MPTKRFSDFACRAIRSAVLMGTLMPATPIWADEPKQRAEKPDQEMKISQLPLEQLIERTLSKSSDVRAAESAVIEAQIALERTRQNAAREVAATRSAVEIQQLQIEGLLGRLQAAQEEENLIKSQVQGGQGSTQDSLQANIKVRESKNLLRIEQAKLSDIEERLRYLAGAGAASAGGTSPSTISAPTTKSTARKAVDPLTDPMTETMRQRFLAIADKPTELDFTETPLVQVLDWLKDYSDIRFVVHEEAFEGENTNSLMEPIDLNLKGVSFIAALSAIQDLRPPLKFVVRPYGVLVTVERGEPAGSITVDELYRATKATGDSRNK